MSCQNYKQYDSRWAGRAYAGENMSAAGCGPTATADIIGVLPTEIADWMTSHGYASNGYGTSWYGPTAALDAYGYNGQQLNSGSLYGSGGTSTENTWLSKMKTGKYYGILLMGPGNFTSGGHFICITQTDSNNRCYVHDPASSSRDGWHNWSAFQGDVKVFYLADNKSGGQASSGGGSKPSDWTPIGTATCTDSPVNFRSTPAIRNDNILCQLNAGNRFEVDGYTTGVWVRGYVANVGVGYIHEDYVKYDQPASSNTTTTPSASTELRQVPGARAYSENRINYRVHQETVGWLDHVEDGQVAGITGHAKRMEAIKIDCKMAGVKIKAKAHIEKKGTVDYGYITSDTIIGTVGQKLRLEGIELEAEGLPSNMKLYIRYHIQTDGWSEWITGTMAGTAGLGKRLEAIQIKIE